MRAFAGRYAVPPDRQPEPVRVVHLPRGPGAEEAVGSHAAAPRAARAQHAGAAPPPRARQGCVRACLGFASVWAPGRGRGAPTGRVRCLVLAKGAPLAGGRAGGRTGGRVAMLASACSRQRAGGAGGRSSAPGHDATESTPARQVSCGWGGARSGPLPGAQAHACDEAGQQQRQRGHRRRRRRRGAEGGRGRRRCASGPREQQHPPTPGRRAQGVGAWPGAPALLLRLPRCLVGAPGQGAAGGTSGRRGVWSTRSSPGGGSGEGGAPRVRAARFRARRCALASRRTWSWRAATRTRRGRGPRSRRDPR